MTHDPPPIPVDIGADAIFSASRVEIPAEVLDRLGDACDLDTGPEALTEQARDWWPVSILWATRDLVPARPAAVARPDDPAQVAAVAAICNDAGIPLTATAGRSGVCGAAVSLHGGLALDLRGLSGLRDVNTTDLIADVGAGTFGDDLEDALRAEHGVTAGHWPQSMALSTVGGWLACRSAGQLSNRYGTIADIVSGLDVVLADGTMVRTDSGPRSATGPDLTQLFVGSEGTLGLVTGARLHVWPVPRAAGRRAYGFDDFAAGLEACRHLAQRRCEPAVMRLYDRVEAERNFGLDTNLLLLLDEADPLIVAATMSAADDECAAAERLDDAPVAQWLDHRNDVSALGEYIGSGVMVDTMEVAGPWSRLDEIRSATCAAIGEVSHTVAVSAHQSHAYPDGACLYFTFAGTPPPDEAERYYVEAWNRGTRAALERGANLSHHHGIGINRARFLAEATGAGHAILESMKQALDPNGILNPGKLGLSDRFGAVSWPR